MKKFLQTLILTFLSVGLFAVLGAILPGIDMFEPLSRALNDIAVTDIYYSSLRDASPEDNDKILIVDTHMSDRREIAEAVANAVAGGAAAIGIDITFIYRDTDPEATRCLCEAMEAGRDKIVAAIHLNKWDEAMQAYVSDIPTAIDSLKLDRGFTNILNSSDNSFIRNYMMTQGRVPSFAAAVADKYLREYGGELDLVPGTGMIHFVPQHFKKFKASESTILRRHADGKIVLLGALGSDDDYHYTPIGVLNGVEIQAYSIESMLNHPNCEASMTGTWIICSLIVFMTSLGFLLLRQKFEHRNIIANRYTCAVLGLGNIIYPTVAIIITIFLIGILYLFTSVYFPPLVILGSQAFIPVAYDIMGIFRHIMQFSRIVALISLLIFFPVVASACIVSSSEKDPTEQIHSVYITHNKIQDKQKGRYTHFDIKPWITGGRLYRTKAYHNQIVNGKKGIQFLSDFTTVNTGSSKLYKVVVIINNDGDNMLPPMGISSSLFDAILCDTAYIQLSDHVIDHYEGVSVFIPYDKFLPDLSKGKKQTYVYRVLLLDENNSLLDEGRAQKFYYNVVKKSSSPYKSDEGMSIDWNHIWSREEIVDGRKGIAVKGSLDAEGIKGKLVWVEFLFFDMDWNPYDTLISGSFSIKVVGKDMSHTAFIPYERFNIPVGEEQTVRIVAYVYDDSHDWVVRSESTFETVTGTVPPSNTKTNSAEESDSTKTINLAYTSLNDNPMMPLPQTVKFAFTTPENSKFYNRNFDLHFITNSHSLTYTISGEEGQHVVPRTDIEAGLHMVTLPRRSCELVMVDELLNIHKINFIYDQEKSLRQNSTLYILSIGVNNYPAKNLDDLKYAEADANAVAKIFADGHKNTFGNIRKKVLIGKNVTSYNIEEELHTISQNAGVNDMVVIFFAGHGLIDDHNKYYLATSEITDGNIPRKGGFSSTLFNELVDYIDCKVVIFIDACYSGKLIEGMRGDANEEFLQQLASTQKGTNLFMSSKADTRSREDSQYCHGVFTQALIEACDFNKSDFNRDGEITVEEIRSYLKQRITEMTKGQQIPLHLNKEEINYPLFIK